MDKDFDAIIVGLGPVGSFTALLLESHGLKVLAIDIALFPFKYPTTSETAYFGGILIHIWTWSLIKCPSSITTPFLFAKSWNISPKCFRMGPNINFCRRFGINTTPSGMGQTFIISHRFFPSFFWSRKEDTSTTVKVGGSSTSMSGCAMDFYVIYKIGICHNKWAVILFVLVYNSRYSFENIFDTAYSIYFFEFVLSGIKISNYSGLFVVNTNSISNNAFVFIVSTAAVLTS